MRSRHQLDLFSRSSDIPLPDISVGSLFSGIEGLGWGLEEAVMHAGGRSGVAFQVERNPYSSLVLANYWPKVPRFDDVRTVNRGDLTVPRVSWLVGGSPCQDIAKSAARWGRKGFGGKRSGLWGQFVRLIGELRPELVIWENVGGALCPVREKGKVVAPAPVGSVLHDLHQLDYDAWWTTVLGGAVGATQLRLRVIVVGIRRERAPAARSPFHGSRLRLDLGPDHWPAPPGSPQHAWEPKRSIRKSDSVPFHMERIEADGNTVIPQFAFAVGGAAYALHRFAGMNPQSIKVPPRIFRARAARTPQAQTKVLISEAMGLCFGTIPTEPFGSFEQLGEEWQACDGSKGSQPQMCGSWPGIGYQRNGELRIPTDAPMLGSGTCTLEGCDGADPVDALQIKLWPTATARDWRSGKSSEATRARNARPLSEVAAPDGFLNPAWVDMHQGFPADYTLLNNPGIAQRKRGKKLE